MSKDKYKIALLGGRGYVGQEIIKLLNSHPLFDLSMAFSKSLAEKNVDGYIKNPNLKYTNLSLESLSLPDIDIVICALANGCLLYTSPSPRDRSLSRMPSSA